MFGWILLALIVGGAAWYLWPELTSGGDDDEPLGV